MHETANWPAVLMCQVEERKPAIVRAKMDKSYT